MLCSCRTSFLPRGVSHFCHRLAKDRFSVGAFVILSVGLCQSRKDRYLPPERLCVRLLPRPNGLASSRFQKISVTCYARAKNLLPPPRSRVLTDASASVLTSPSCPARRLCQRMYVCIEIECTTSFCGTALLPMCIRLTLYIDTLYAYPCR